MALQSLSFSGALLFVLQKTHFFLLFSLVFGVFFFHCLWVGFFVVVFSQLLFPCCLLLLLLYTRLVKISCAGGADLWAARSASIAVTRNTTVYFIRSQMKWNGPRTCTVTWAWIKVQIGVLLPRCCHPPPSDGTNSTHVLGCSTRQCPGGKGLWGPPGVLGLGSSHCPCQGAGCWGGWNGIPGRLGRAIKAHACPRVWQHPPWFHPGAKPPALKGGRGKGNLTFRGTDSYFHSEPASCRSPPRAAFDGPTDFYCFQYCLFHYLSYRFDLLLRRWILGGLPKKYSGHKRRMAQNHLIFNHRL